MSSSLPELEQRRAELYGELACSEDFRRGSVSATYRRCGKANCACADPAHPGHGPRHLLTRSVEGEVPQEKWCCRQDWMTTVRQH